MSFLLRPFSTARDDEAADMADNTVIQVRSPEEAGKFQVFPPPPALPIVVVVPRQFFYPKSLKPFFPPALQ